MLTAPAPDDADARLRWRAALLSLVVATAVLAIKFWAFEVTGSKAVLSDALESIVNVVAAAFAIGGIVFAGLPADRNHPFGHGKIEFFAAAFEGGLIAFAALAILWESLQGFVQGSTVRELDFGLLVVFVAGVINAALGTFLLRAGRRYRSLTLIADGRHVLADSWTSAGVLIGLLLVKLTGLPWIDPAVAAVMAVWLLITGARLVRHAAGGLLDEEDPEVVGRIVEMLGNQVGNGVISVHHLRAIRAGRFHHVSAHLVVPEFWSVERAHDLADGLAARVLRQVALEGEITFHTDPCHRAYCERCDVEVCSVRAQPFLGRQPLTIDDAVRPDAPRLSPGT
ncbi:MAG: cation transporter [Planctomycetes bacterium]|nr:cation transporter [Planctomycetota bacterium]